MEYQQKNPLRYYALPFLFEFVNDESCDIKNNLLAMSAFSSYGKMALVIIYNHDYTILCMRGEDIYAF
jgi:hypothetical protein